MTAEHFQEVLEALLNRRPFQGFTVELVGGHRIQIDHPHATAVRGGKAFFIGPGSVPHWFDHDSVTQIIDEIRDAPRKS